MKRILIPALAAVIAVILAACSSSPALTDCNVIHEDNFGGVYIENTIDEFNALGFEYGDSVDITFSNGYEMKDIPYYNGYYTDIGDPLLVAYPGYDYIRAGINNGDDLWVLAGLKDGDTVDISLRERGKYLDIQEARDIHYEDDRDLYDSDEIFANFRNIQVGDIREDVLYRSASPCDNQHNRASYVDKMLEKNGIRYVVNLAESDDEIRDDISGSDFNSPYFLSLYQSGKVIPLYMKANYNDEDFRNKLVKGLKAIAANEGPYDIHCAEGKDRTGFVCMVAEALCGASYEEITDDYMETYYNYYGITKDDDKYDIIVKHVLDPMIYIVTGDESVNLKTADLASYAEKFLKDAGMNDKDIEDVRDRLTVN